jgi:hypothetical protein
MLANVSRAFAIHPMDEIFEICAIRASHAQPPNSLPKRCVRENIQNAGPPSQEALPTAPDDDTLSRLCRPLDHRGRDVMQRVLFDHSRLPRFAVGCGIADACDDQLPPAMRSLIQLAGNSAINASSVRNALDKLAIQ